MRLDKVIITNFKTLTDVSIDVGRVNVFIGANGVGKTSILDAIGIISATMVERTSDRLLEERGVRLGTPYLYKSSFAGRKTPPFMSFGIKWHADDDFDYQYKFSLNAPRDRVNYEWKFHSEALTRKQTNETIFGRSNRSATFDEFDLIKISRDRSMYSVLKDTITPSIDSHHFDWQKIDINQQLANFGIYAPNTLMLRGVMDERVSRAPVGLYGSNLPNAVSDLVTGGLTGPESERLPPELHQLCHRLFFINDWCKSVISGARNLNILSPNVTAQPKVLKFTDRYMDATRNIVTAYDANEGALYSLFLACLLFHPLSPEVFAVDNVDYGLNPRVAREVARIFSEYAKLTDKTIFLTTHNPLILDGLDLRNDDVRLFRVERNRKGITKVTRIMINELIGEEENSYSSLSQLWLSGQLGGMPNL